MVSMNIQKYYQDLLNYYYTQGDFEELDDFLIAG